MNRTITILCACLSVGTLAVSAFAAEAPRAVSPAEKTASDGNVSAGLAQEQAALAAMGQNGGAAAAAGDLQAAYNDMHLALPIYHGYRARSMGIAKRCITEIGKPHKNPAKAAARISEQINKAIADAQLALTHSDTVTGADDAEPAL